MNQECRDLVYFIKTDIAQMSGFIRGSKDTLVYFPNLEFFAVSECSVWLFEIVVLKLNGSP